MTTTNDIRLSKTLSWLLRHGAVKEGLNIKSDGFISVVQLLEHKNLNGKYNLVDIERVVETDSKKRFSLRNNKGVLEICANQGHSINIVDDLNLSIIDYKEDVNIIHGTYYRYWKFIKKQGLNRMKRNHIHFALGLPYDVTVTSGIRKDTEIFIYINLRLAISDNLKFYRSANNVILSPGDKNGVILPKYFQKVVDKHSRLLL
ncbi:tRNA 2'-phosphotransferase 1 [Diorhabda sublineata]|uniref:tRNA 2'-phosphotransferase 1 n=1 Tax=Diorhabda sublineata TaxID=1163346 RepID=UPI0024E0CADF|nr:tRNA 2'-phosphotransferase 1 [Diorhabda sublineata]